MMDSSSCRWFRKKLSERSLQRKYLMTSASISPNVKFSKLMLSYAQSRSPTEWTNTTVLKGYGESVLCTYMIIHRRRNSEVLEFRVLALIRSEIKMNVVLSNWIYTQVFFLHSFSVFCLFSSHSLKNIN